MQSITNQGLVLKLKKSIYGIKQSGRNGNKVLHQHHDAMRVFEQNSADHCVYRKDTGDGVIVWVDDLIIAANSLGKKWFTSRKQ